MNAPKEVIDLAEQRIQARVNKDFALSDQLRDKISDLGYVIKDNPGGYELVVKPPFEVFDNLASIKIKPDRLSKKVTICLLIDGWLEDTKECINALLKFMPQDSSILALDLGNKESVGNYLAEVEKTNQRLIELNPAEFSVVMDLSSIISGDAITPLINQINGEIVAAGWKGSLVKLDDEWRSVEDKGEGEVDILLGYLFAIKTKIAQKIPANSKAKFYRNADLEWSLELRSKGHKLVALGNTLPVEQKRHHGYHDSDTEYREKESKKTYDRILQNYRGKTQILSPRR
jgi:hypothetical protein